MRARGAIPLLAAFAIIPLSIAAAQAPSAGSPANDPHAVTVTFLAEDELGNSVSNLQISDLSVADNGQPPMRIVSLGSAKDLPLRLGILIDNNPFYGLYYSDKLPEYDHTPQWVLDFAEEMLTGPDDKAFIASYSSVQHGAVFVSRDQLRPIDLAHFLKSDAPVYFGVGEAVRAACDVFSADPAGRERRILIVIAGSDRQVGSEELRHYQTIADQNISAAAERAGVKVFTFGWMASDHPGKGPLVYDPVYQPIYGWFETGGWVLTRQPDPSSWFKLLKSQIDSLYSLTYVPAEPYQPGKRRKLDLKITTNKSWRVYAPKSYLAPSAQ
jgi:hypothetical protein